jgi:hypothetical protein
MVGELNRLLRDTSWRLHVPPPLKEHTMQSYKAADSSSKLRPLPHYERAGPASRGGRGGRAGRLHLKC